MGSRVRNVHTSLSNAWPSLNQFSPEHTNAQKIFVNSSYTAFQHNPMNGSVADTRSNTDGGLTDRRTDDSGCNFPLGRDSYDAVLFDTCWTLHHCDNWRIENRLDATYYFIVLLIDSTRFEALLCPSSGARELLMMGIVVPEICWAYKNHNKIIIGI